MLEQHRIGAEKPAVNVLLRDQARMKQGRVERERGVTLGEHKAVALLPGGAVRSSAHNAPVEHGENLCRREAATQVERHVWVSVRKLDDGLANVQGQTGEPTPFRGGKRGGKRRG